MRWQKPADVSLMMLAIATIPTLIVEASTTGAVAAAAAAVNWTIWTCFAVDLVVRTSLARGQRWQYLRRSWLDVAIVALTVIPYLLPIRALRSAHALRLLNAGRVAVYATRAAATAKRLWTGLVGRQLLVSMPLVVVAGATGIWFTEADTNSALAHYGDALWWATVTVTTVGYGDIAPVTAWGRIIATAMMVVGIALFGVVTANIANRINSNNP